MKIKLSFLFLFLTTLVLGQSAIPPKNIGGLQYERITQIVQPVQPAVLDSLGGVVTPAQPAVLDTVVTSKIVGLQLFRPSNPSITIPHTLAIQFLSNTMDMFMNHTIQARVVYFDTDSTTSMLDKIDRDPSLSPDAKLVQKQLFRSVDINAKSTANSYVNPATGQLLPPGDTSGMPETEFMQRLRYVDIGAAPNTPVLVVEYSFIIDKLRQFAEGMGL